LLSLSPPLPRPAHGAVARVLRWSMDGLRLWRRAPIALPLLSLVVMVVEAALQLVPGVGIVLSKLMVSLLGAGLLVGMDGLARGQRLGAGCLVLARGQIPPELRSPGFLLVLILPGLVPATLLVLAMPLVVFERLPAIRAVGLSVRLVLGAPGAFGLFLLVSLALTALALLLKGLPLLLLAPWLLAANYAIYRDLRTG
jgi:hypothetical protein